jgi:hypothetical protein
MRLDPAVTRTVDVVQRLVAAFLHDLCQVGTQIQILDLTVRPHQMANVDVLRPGSLRLLR